MQLKIFEAASNRQAMAEIRETLGPDAVIVATHEDGNGVRITAAIGSADETIGDLLCPPAAALDDKLDDCLRHHRLPAVCRQDLLQVAERHGGSEPEFMLSQAIEHCYRFDQLSFDRPLMLIGLPGSGKTATCAKLAARFCLEGQAVQVLSCDTTRAGGTAQLRQLLAAMQLDLTDIADAADLRQQLADRPADRPVLIDSCGFDPFRGDELIHIAELVTAAKAEPILVAAASTIAEDALEAADNLRAIGVRRAIVTKLDLARRYGAIAALGHGGIALSEAGFSPLIASALTPLTPEGLARLLSRRRSADEEGRP